MAEHVKRRPDRRGDGVPVSQGEGGRGPAGAHRRFGGLDVPASPHGSDPLPDLRRERLDVDIDHRVADRLLTDRSDRNPNVEQAVATPITILQRRAALDRASAAVDTIRAAADALSWSLGPEAAPRLARAADAASAAIGDLRQGSNAPLGVGLALAVTLHDTAEAVAVDLPADLGHLLSTAAADVLDPLVDVVLLGLGRPLPWLAAGGRGQHPSAALLAGTTHPGAVHPAPGSPGC